MFAVRIARAALAIVLPLAFGGCGIVAGLGDDYFGDFTTARDASTDKTVPHTEAGLTESEASSPPPGDGGIPGDVVYADANDEPPAPFEAGCKNPSTCSATAACCAPAVCNGVAKCAGSCIKDNTLCGNTAACCLGLSCDENAHCVSQCVTQPGGDCTDETCCTGLVCPQGPQPKNCQQCLQNFFPCNANWECCSKLCVQGQHGGLCVHL